MFQAPIEDPGCQACMNGEGPLHLASSSGNAGGVTDGLAVGPGSKRRATGLQEESGESQSTPGGKRKREKPARATQKSANTSVAENSAVFDIQLDCIFGEADFFGRRLRPPPPGSGAGMHSTRVPRPTGSVNGVPLSGPRFQGHMSFCSPGGQLVRSQRRDHRPKASGVLASASQDRLH